MIDSHPPWALSYREHQRQDKLEARARSDNLRFLPHRQGLKDLALAFLLVTDLSVAEITDISETFNPWVTPTIYLRLERLIFTLIKLSPSLCSESISTLLVAHWLPFTNSCPVSSSEADSSFRSFLFKSQLRLSSRRRFLLLDLCGIIYIAFLDNLHVFAYRLSIGQSNFRFAVSLIYT